MNAVLAIDPGTTESGWVAFQDGAIVEKGIDANQAVLVRASAARSWGAHLAVEMIASYGMPVGREVFETCLWIGRFLQAAQPCETHLIYRKDVKMHLCNSMRARDAHIRQALLDRFGPGREIAIGRKASQGPLYGIKKHMWAALAVAVTFSDRSSA